MPSRCGTWLGLGLFALLSLYGAAVGALSTDKDQPIDIEADWAEQDDIKRTRTYKGDVVVTQGSIRIVADLVTMYYTEDDKLERVIGVGNPARFRQQPDEKPDEQCAEAARMEYFVDATLIELTGNAKVTEGESQVQGHRITYNTETGNSAAAADPNRKERVKITIPPRGQEQASPGIKCP